MDENNLKFEIINKPQIGRCIQATRDIEPLEIILTDTPSVLGPHHDSQPVCLQCLRIHEGDYYCSTCKLPYCDEECSDTSQHRSECFTLSKLSEICQDMENKMMVIMVMRLIRLKMDNSELWSDIDNLMDHVNERQECTEEWEMFQTKVVDVLKLVLEINDETLIHRMIGIVCVNSVGFDYKKTSVKGRALYPLLSLVSHSCVSNARYTVNYDDFTVTLRARRKINEGEEITINYVPPIFGVPKRKRHIEEEWYFICKCARCADNTEFGTYVSALKCSNCREGLILPETVEKSKMIYPKLAFCAYYSNKQYICSKKYRVLAESG
ncbi:histone-lysine N-methyltransferase ASHR1 [Eurytemora carolleeae]|uniref:histone-lysine N-methyltransferase ASHR1 n=1 Tax=Eurytemora carolleeae TaxID=1294199 RepID=UPI000C76FC7E|nr:histone-lysine N-methyltransferase ASHR1 [Eurytemora carolleeae]|eukprot:XP_023326813.1 histone-lysine N-methyltransferase ASHR1-like [Eurytemora affinis]